MAIAFCGSNPVERPLRQCLLLSAGGWMCCCLHAGACCGGFPMYVDICVSICERICVYIYIGRHKLTCTKINAQQCVCMYVCILVHRYMCARYSVLLRLHLCSLKFETIRCWLHPTTQDVVRGWAQDVLGRSSFPPPTSRRRAQGTPG